MSSISLVAFPPNETVLQTYALPLDGAGARCLVRLRNLPGAEHLHVLLRNGDAALLRADIPAESGELLRLEIALDADGRLKAECPGRPVILLPADPALPPPERPIKLQGQQEDLDLAIVVDATVRVFEPGKAGRLLLADGKLWAGQVAKLCAFVVALAAHFKACRFAVLAFGDQPVPNTTALDLQPAYRLYPEEVHPGLLRTVDALQVERQLLSLAPSSGGDFVDALADALAACQALRWDPRARKIILVSGDSPGHSIAKPPPKGADACVRRRDVDTEAARLHRLGVELLTLYHAPDPGFVQGLIAPQREFQRYAQDQYQGLASLPELAFTAAQFEGQREAGQVLGLSGLVGRGVSYGEWGGIDGDAG